jgi:hypothetical protein
MPDQAPRTTSAMVKLGAKVLAASYNTLSAEKLRNTRSPQYSLRTAWPQYLGEFSDLVQGTPNNLRRYYTADEIRCADAICTIFSRLPYTRDQKKMTLLRARGGKSWREIATMFKVPWLIVRRAAETVLVYLILTVIAADRRAPSRAFRWR